MTTLAIARRCGWRYDWVDELPVDVYRVLIDQLLKEQADEPGKV